MIEDVKYGTNPNLESPLGTVYHYLQLISI